MILILLYLDHVDGIIIPHLETTIVDGTHPEDYGDDCFISERTIFGTVD